MVFIDPFHNYTAAAMGGKWIAPRIGTDTAIAMAIATSGSPRGRTTGNTSRIARSVSMNSGLHSGQAGWLSQDPGVGGGTVGYRRADHQGARPRMGVQADGPLRRRPRWRGRRLPPGLRHRMGAHDGAVAGHAGTGQTRDQHLGHQHGRAGGRERMVPGIRRSGGENFDHPRRGCLSGKSVTQRLYRPIVPDAILDPPIHWLGDGFCNQSLAQQFTPHTYPRPAARK